MSAQQSKSSLAVKSVKFIVDAIWYLGWFAAALVLVIMIAVLVGFRPNALQVKAPIELTYIDETDAGGIPFDQRPTIMNIKGYATVLLPPDNPVWHRFTIIILPLLMAGFLYGAYQMRRFFRTVKDGVPFHPDNPKRIRRIGYVVMAWGPAQGFFFLLQGWLTLREVQVPADDLTIPGNIMPGLIFVGLVIVVIAQIFDMGVKLQQEQNLTV